MTNLSNFDHMTALVTEDIYLLLKDDYESYAGEKNFRSVKKTKDGKYNITYRNVRTNDPDFDLIKLKELDETFDKELTEAKKVSLDSPVYMPKIAEGKIR